MVSWTEPQVAGLLRDLRSFARFAATVAGPADLSAERLARSRIRKQVVAGLAPNYCTPDTARVINDVNRES